MSMRSSLILATSPTFPSLRSSCRNIHLFVIQVLHRRTSAFMPKELTLTPFTSLLVNSTIGLYVVKNISILPIIDVLQPVLISPRNSREGVVHLINESHSTHLLVDKDSEAYARSLGCPIPVITFADMSCAENSVMTPLSTFTKEQLEVEMSYPAYYVHTSGTTGHPKLIGEVSALSIMCM